MVEVVVGGDGEIDLCQVYNQGLDVVFEMSSSQALTLLNSLRSFGTSPAHIRVRVIDTLGLRELQLWGDEEALAKLTRQLNKNNAKR